MQKLISVELLKIKKSMSIKIIFALMCALSLVTAFSSINYINSAKAAILEIPLTGYDAYFSSMRDMPTIVFLGILVTAITICSDFENGFIQMEIALGYTRRQIVLAKLFSSFIAYCIVCFPYPFTRLLIQSFIGGFGHSFDLGAILKIISVFFVIVLIGLSLNSISAILTYILKRNVLVVAMSFVILILGGNSLLAVASSNNEIATIIYNTPLGFFRNLAQSNYGLYEICLATIVSSFFIILGNSIILYLFNKMELK